MNAPEAGQGRPRERGTAVQTADQLEELEPPTDVRPVDGVLDRRFALRARPVPTCPRSVPDDLLGLHGRTSGTLRAQMQSQRPAGWAFGSTHSSADGTLVFPAMRLRADTGSGR